MSNRKYFEKAHAKLKPVTLSQRSDAELVGMVFGTGLQKFVQKECGGDASKLLEYDIQELILFDGIGYATAVRLETAVILAARWKARGTI
jgi:DNA repair protein RadC